MVNLENGAWEINRNNDLKGVLDEHGIAIPFPQRVVHHMGNGSDAGGDDTG